MDPAVLLRVIHDQQVKLHEYEAKLADAYRQLEAALIPSEEDAEVR